MNKLKQKMTLNPAMTFIILILITILLSAFLNLIGFEATYDKINVNTGETIATSESVVNLLSLSGIKYIFTSTVSNFTSFTPLSTIIIVLIGIGIMEKSGFMKTTFTILTKYCKKYTITFWLVLMSIVFSIMGNIGYAVMIPITALIFTYGRRNPILGITAVYAGLTCGHGLNILMNSIDTEMLNYTLANAKLIDPNYTLGTTCFLFIMAFAIIVSALLITFITEKIATYKVEKYEYKEEKKEVKIGKKEYRGLIFAISAGAIYLLIFTYNIIPGLPFSGNFLDYTQEFYIDKLFSHNSFFSNGFVFIVTMFFIIIGLFYGIGAKTIKNNNDFCEDLSHSLDGTGGTLITILLGSILINIFKKSNIGTVVLASFANIIKDGSFNGVALIVVLFILTALATFFTPSSTAKWAIISTTAVPVFMNNSLSPEFAQLIARFSECVVIGLTPLLAYFTIYISYIEKYNQNEKPISLFTTLRYQMPYSLCIGAVLLIIILGWYFIGIPLGINGAIGL